MDNQLNLRVMTFNLLTATKKRRSHPWHLRKHNIAKVFHNVRPDIVGTQEANFQQLCELAELLPDYDFVGEGNLGRDNAYDEGNWYCATFFRRDRLRLLDQPGLMDTEWLSPTPLVPASQYNFGTRPRLVTWNTFELIGELNGELIGPGRQFVFGTTHLEAVNRGHRRRSAIQLRAYISRKVAEMGPDTPVFLTGDFNAVSSSREIQAMGTDLGEGLLPMYDAWEQSGVGADPNQAGTFRGLGLRDRVGMKLLGQRRIDYVFFRPQLTVQTVNRIDFSGLDNQESALPSDHYPVLAEFRLAG